MNADSTLFDNHDLTEPGYGGQVVAYSVHGSGSKQKQYEKLLIHTVGISQCVGCNTDPPLRASERRLFKRIDGNAYMGLGASVWVDRTDERFLFSDLRDIVIINRGTKL